MFKYIVWIFIFIFSWVFQVFANQNLNDSLSSNDIYNIILTKENWVPWEGVSVINPTFSPYSLFEWITPMYITYNKKWETIIIDNKLNVYDLNSDLIYSSWISYLDSWVKIIFVEHSDFLIFFQLNYWKISWSYFFNKNNNTLNYFRFWYNDQKIFQYYWNHNFYSQYWSSHFYYMYFFEFTNFYVYWNKVYFYWTKSKSDINLHTENTFYIDLDKLKNVSTSNKYMSFHYLKNLFDYNTSNIYDYNSYNFNFYLIEGNTINNQNKISLDDFFWFKFNKVSSKHILDNNLRKVNSYSIPFSSNFLQKFYFLPDTIYYTNSSVFYIKYDKNEKIYKKWKLFWFFTNLVYDFNNLNLIYDIKNKWYVWSFTKNNFLWLWEDFVNFYTNSENLFDISEFFYWRYHFWSFYNKKTWKQKIISLDRNFFTKQELISNNSRFIIFAWKNLNSWNYNIYYYDSTKYKLMVSDSSIDDLKGFHNNNFYDSYNPNTWEFENDWDVGEPNEEEWSIILQKLAEKVKTRFSWISEIFEFFVLPFPQEKDTYSVTIPFISISKNNEINYKKLTVDLPNFDDYNSLNVINVKDSDNNSLWKKFLSFLLWVFYILIRFVLVLFFFLPFILFYFIAEKLTSFLFWWLWHNSWWSSVIWKFVFWVYFATLYVPLVAIILWLFIFIPMFNIWMDYLNSVFWYILSNYLDYTFFLWFVNWFFIFLSVWIVSHFVYIIYKNN